MLQAANPGKPNPLATIGVLVPMLMQMPAPASPGEAETTMLVVTRLAECMFALCFGY